MKMAEKNVQFGRKSTFHKNKNLSNVRTPDMRVSRLHYRDRYLILVT